MQESYDFIRQNQGDFQPAEDGSNQANILEQDAIFFGADVNAQNDKKDHNELTMIPTAHFSSDTLLALRIKDFANQSNIQLKHPVCFECFSEILKQLEDKVKSHEEERDMYKEELQEIEKELAEAENLKDEEMLKELKALEEQERELDKGLEDIAKQEAEQEKMMENLSKSKEVIHSQENDIWSKVNDYERELMNQLEMNKQVDCQIKNVNILYKKLRKTNIINEVFKISSQD